MLNCPNCGSEITIPSDAKIGEVVACHDCANDYEISKDSSGFKLKKTEGELSDWGE